MRERKEEPWRALERKPVVFELVEVLGAGEAVQAAWWTGTGWDAGAWAVVRPVRAWRRLRRGAEEKAPRRRGKKNW